MSLSTKVPWWAKVVIKTIMGLIPVPYEHMRNCFTGNKGGMENPEYAHHVFSKFQAKLLEYDRMHRINGSTLMELGPGGSLLNGFLGKAAGFRQSILVDVGDFASCDTVLYQQFVDLLQEEDQIVYNNALKASKGNVFKALKKIGIFYYTSGVQSMKLIKDQSIDFSFSNAVLEHIKRDDFNEFLEELYRIHNKSSLSMHQVDYKDHLGGSLNNLRFTHKFWESRWFPNQGFYTNRLRHSEIKALFEEAGFSIIDEELKIWQGMPFTRNKLSKDFDGLPNRDLSINGAFIVAKKSL